MPDVWTEIAADDTVRALRATNAGSGAAREALSVLMTDPATRGFLRVETSLGDDGNGESMSYLVPRTRVFINRERAKDLRGDVYATGAVWALSQSLTWSAAVAVFRKLVQTVKLLDDAELDVLAVIAVIGASSGDVAPVPTERILAAYDDGRPGLDALLELALIVQHEATLGNGGYLHLQQRPQQPVYVVESLMEEDRGDHRLERIRQQWISLPAATLLLAFPELQRRAELHRTCEASQRRGADKRGTQGGQLAFTFGGKRPVEEAGGYEVEHGIAQELETFVGLENEIPLFVHVGAMNQRCVKQRPVLESYSCRLKVAPELHVIPTRIAAPLRLRYCSNRLNTRLTLWPPNPNEFETT